LNAITFVITVQGDPKKVSHLAIYH